MGRKKCLHVVDGGRVVYMGGYSIAPESLRAHKSCVFVKQQKARKREGVWKDRETKANQLEFNKAVSGL